MGKGEGFLLAIKGASTYVDRSADIVVFKLPGKRTPPLLVGKIDILTNFSD